MLAVLGGVLYELTKSGSPSGVKCFSATFARLAGRRDGALLRSGGNPLLPRQRAGAPRVAEACRKAGFAVGATPVAPPVSLLR